MAAVDLSQIRRSEAECVREISCTDAHAGLFLGLLLQGQITWQVHCCKPLIALPPVHGALYAAGYMATGLMTEAVTEVHLALMKTLQPSLAMLQRASCRSMHLATAGMARRCCLSAVGWWWQHCCGSRCSNHKSWWVAEAELCGGEMTRHAGCQQL